MQNNRFKMIASGYLMLIRKGKILLSRRYNTGYEDGKYSLPAGHIEDNERLTAGTSREVREEIGLQINPADLTLVHVMHRKKDDIRMDFFFTVKKYNGVPKNIEPHRCSDLSWFPLNQLPVNTIPYIRHAIESYQKKQWYSEFGWRET